MEAMLMTWAQWQWGLCFFWCDLAALNRTFYGPTRYLRSRPLKSGTPAQHRVD